MCLPIGTPIVSAGSALIPTYYIDADTFYAPAVFGVAHGQEINVNNTGRAGAAALGIAGYNASLTTINGDNTYNTTQTFNNVHFTGKIKVTGGTVTFNFCLFDAQPDPGDTGPRSAALQIYDDGNECGALIANWCTFDTGLRGSQGLFETEAFQAGERPNNPVTFGTTSSFNLYRCSMRGYGNGISVHRWANIPMSYVTECYIADVTTGSGNHPDGIEYYSSGNVTVQRCRFMCQGVQGVNLAPSGVTWPQGYDCIIKDCYIRGGLPIICGDPGPVYGAQWSGNYFSDETGFGDPTYFDFADLNATNNLAYHEANPGVAYWALTNVWAPDGEGVDDPVEHVPGAYISHAYFFEGADGAWQGSMLDFSAVPVVTPATFTVAAGYGLDAFIGHVDATNSPTSYAIVSGDPSGFFAIYPSGNLRTAESTPAPPGNYTLQITATNPTGTSDPATFNVRMGVQALFANAYVDSDNLFSHLMGGGILGLAPSVYSDSDVFLGPILVGGGAQGYDNLANWPSADNRPTWNAENSTLSWIGPTGGGASTSNDTAQSQVLTNSGGISSSSNGQVIEHLNVSGQITVSHDNVIIRQCRIRTSSSPVVFAQSGATGCLVEDCILDGMSGSGQAGSVAFHLQGMMRRCNVFGVENGNDTGGPMTVIDCWIHDLAASGADPHYDGLQTDGGHDGPVLYQHNNIECGSNVNACIEMSNFFGSLDSVTMTGNRCTGANRPIWVDARFNSNLLTNLVITNNRIGQGESPEFIFLQGSTKIPSPVISGNVDDATGNPINADIE
jgi:hypothetical protein